MILTDEILKKSFKFGASLVDDADEDAVPVHGLLQPNPDDADTLDLWITDGANTVLSREVEQHGEGYTIKHHGKAHTLLPLPKEKAVKP